MKFAMSLHWVQSLSGMAQALSKHCIRNQEIAYVLPEAETYQSS
jgi:hypothetical protein